MSRVNKALDKMIDPDFDCQYSYRIYSRLSRPAYKPTRYVVHTIKVEKK